MPFKKRLTDTFLSGDISNNIQWDGVMCSKPKLNVKLPNERAQMSLNFNTKGKSIK